MWLEEKEQPYVLVVSDKAHVWAGVTQPQVSEVLDALREGRLPLDESEESWERLSAGVGSKGPRFYDWIRLPLNLLMQQGFSRWLLVRRQIDDPDELTAYMAFTLNQSTTLEELAKVAGSRWKIEEAFEVAKGEVGLDHYEVRSWVGWHNHIILAMFAHAFLCAIRASGHEVEPSQKGALRWKAKRAAASRSSRSGKGSDLSDSIDVTRNKKAVVADRLGQASSTPGGSGLVGMAAPGHQAVARRCHYKKRAAQYVG